MTRPPARLSVLLARTAPIAAVFRRGPSRWTAVLSWNTETDVVELGDWIHGALYPDQCDLSPDGRHLISFASAYHGPNPGLDLGLTWTAISELPSLRPIAAWPENAPVSGGGLFLDDRRLRILGPLEPTPPTLTPAAAEFEVTFERQFSVEHERFERGGWALVQALETDHTSRWQTTVRPEIRQRSLPDGGDLVRKQRWTKQGSLVRFERVGPDGATVDLPVAWADVDQTGRLVGAADGCLVALHIDDGVVGVEVLADLNPFTPPSR
jgi:hypothetical protein